MGQKKNYLMILCSTAVWKAGLVINEMKSLGIQLRRFQLYIEGLVQFLPGVYSGIQEKKRLVEGETYKPKKEKRESKI